ncbi:regulator of ime2 [Friedmanniomyces endolithicus]|nr:regulator of ime2 [Friedmanniomyces endolithicus]
MGLLRPATPLALIFFVAFVLLLLSTLSTPVIKAIPLGSYQGWNFGVFGYCKGNNCPSGYKVGYSTDGLFSGTNNSNGNFVLPASTRHSLSAILIVHPIAAFLTLICFGLACAAHFHSPSHSPRYLLGLLILTIPTLLVTLLAFLVDILLFVPHMQWGGWIVLGALVLIIASSVVTCAMRRTLVSRKARKKRIAENADMNGTVYYENMHQNRLMADELPRADSPPPMSGATAVDKPGIAQYAAFEMKRQDTRSGDSGDGAMGAGMTGMNDDQAPLNPTRDPSIRSASTGRGQIPYGPAMGENAPPMPMGRPSMESNNGVNGQRRPSRDQYGNPISPVGLAAGAVGAAGVAAVARDLRHENSQGSLGSNGRAGGYQRGGRAGYRPPGRGYGPPRDGYGSPGQRGNYGPPRGGFRGQGPPPPGWRGRGGYGPPSPGMGPRGGMNRAMSPPGYAGAPQDPYYGGPRSPPGSSAPMRDEFIAGPIGQAIEMDERTGSPPGPLPPAGMQPHAGGYGLRDSDGDVAGMVGLQQERGGPVRMDSERSEGVMSQTSMYSDHTYVPPRAQWAQGQPMDPHHSGVSQPLSSNAMPSSNALPLSPVQASPTSPHVAFAPQHARGGSDAYYEDVDPRFAVDPASEVGMDHPGPLPTNLTPGAGYVGSSYGSQPQQQSSQQYQHQRMPPHPQDPTLLQTPQPTYHSAASQDRGQIPSYVSGGSTDTNHALSTPSLDRPSSYGTSTQTPGTNGNSSSYENLPPGARSPGESSEASHLTSISQRPINPNWRPGPPGSSAAYGGGPPQQQGMGMGMGGAVSTASAAQRRRDDVILNANPDFSLPGMGSGNRGGFRGRGGRGGGGMGGRGMGSPPGGLTPVGRYPTDI